MDKSPVQFGIAENDHDLLLKTLRRIQNHQSGRNIRNSCLKNIKTQTDKQTGKIETHIDIISQSHRAHDNII